MAGTLQIPKTHLIMAICLPLAVILGYFLAEPLDSGSMGMVVFVLTVLAVPIMIKWYHPLLLLSWNAGVVPMFLPGQPNLWMAMALAGLLFATLNRSVNPEMRFSYVPSLTYSLIFLVVVVAITALFSGGFGLRSFGAARFGAKAYFYVLTAIAGYFAFTSRKMPPEKLGLCLAMFFLPSVLNLVPEVATRFSGLAPVFAFFFRVGDPSLSDFEATSPAIYRVFGLGFASTGVAFYLLARYGVRGVLDVKKVFRFIVFVVSVAACVACGFRSMLLLLALAFAFQFFFEGLHRTRLLGVLLGCLVVCVALVFPLAPKLPLSVQRTLSFLPIDVDPVVKYDVLASTTWRLDMWKDLLPDIPKYLLMGKGYGMDPDELWWINRDMRSANPSPHAGAVAAGDFHSGPLSVVIPFGLLGVIAFSWFAVASIRYLYRSYRTAEGDLRQANGFILSLYAAKLVSFVFIAGSLYSDLAFFTGLVGLSVALNGEEPSKAEAKEEEPFNAFATIGSGKDSAQYG